MESYNSQIKENIANNLKKYREIYGLKQKDVSDVLGIDAASYRNWENARSTPKISMLYEIAKIFKTNVNELCGIEVVNESSYTLRSPNEYNKNIYAESKITELDLYEKQLIMRVRRLTNNDKRKVAQCISELLSENEDETKNG